MKTIRISDDNWKFLLTYRINKNFKSIDAVITYMKKKYNMDNKNVSQREK